MSDVTKTSSSHPAPAPDLTRTTFPIHETVGWIRSSARAIDNTATGLHQQTWEMHIDELAASLGRSGVGDLLSRLSDWGFSWRDVARMLRVSVPAVQKWRRGETMTGANRLRLARVVALVSAIEDEALVSEPASWFEMPLVDGVHVSPTDFVEADLWAPLVDFALQHCEAAAALDQFDADWRASRIDNSFETFVDSDGVRAIRPKG